MPIKEVIMPKMGESITDATIIKWHKNVGDPIEEEETLLEVATDKVDSEIPSPYSGIVTQINFKEEEVVDVGAVIAIIGNENEEATHGTEKENEPAKPAESTKSTSISKDSEWDTVKSEKTVETQSRNDDRFYSPLVKSIAKNEGITLDELAKISGTGAQHRVTKRDILNYVTSKNQKTTTTHSQIPSTSTPPTESVKLSSTSDQATNTTNKTSTPEVIESNVEIIEMDRMRKLISKHMVDSLQTSAHVTSFAEADVTNLFKWRNNIKHDFQNKYNNKISLTPLFIEIICKALRKFPKINSSTDGQKIWIKQDLNIGIATALPNGNLIVPVIKSADHLSLHGLTKNLNDTIQKARENKLKPTDIQGGTFTLSNIGTYGSLLGTPIINQPQVAILATGAIKKKPVVIEYESGDSIAIRHMMYLSLSYDHRIIDGYLGGSFLQYIVQLIENFDSKREI